MGCSCWIWSFDLRGYPCHYMAYHGMTDTPCHCDSAYSRCCQIDLYGGVRRPLQVFNQCRVAEYGQYLTYHSRGSTIVCLTIRVVVVVIRLNTCLIYFRDTIRGRY